jgi:hypothetical protein
MRLRFASLILSGLSLTLCTSGCAARVPAGTACPAVPPAAYFADVAKPVPPRRGMKEFLIYVDDLSSSWDNLYIDRMKAREIMEGDVK